MKNGGGQIEHLKEDIIEDSTIVCDKLDKRMQHLIDTYHDKWVWNIEPHGPEVHDTGYSLNIKNQPYPHGELFWCSDMWDVAYH